MQNKNSLITIVTPSFNQGWFIEQTIKSVLSQEGNFYLEYIILDAGSKDDSVEIIKKYDRLLKEGGLPLKCLEITYKWFSEPDRGQTDALNKGLKMANGEIVAWLNSDDKYLPGTLEKVRRAFSQNPESGFVYGDVRFVDEEGKIIRTHRAKTGLSGTDFKYSNPLIQPEVFFRKKLLSEIGFLDESFDVAMDYEFWTRAARQSSAFTYVDSFLAEFTVRKDAKSSALNATMYIEALLVQLKYFGFDSWFVHNWGCYVAEYSEWTNRDPEEAFREITEGLSRRCTKEQKVLLAKNQQRALMLCHLRKAACKTTTSKKAALKYGFFVLSKSPSLLLTRNGAVFLIRMFLKSGHCLQIKEICLGLRRRLRRFF